MSRTIFIDDTDQGIVYSGTWKTDVGGKDTLGNYGAPYLRTMHHIESIGSLSYTFSGSYVGIFGSTSTDANPIRDCYVDDKKVPTANISAAENWFNHCEQQNLPDGLHTVTVNVTAANPAGYWFDFIMIIPSANVSLADSALYVDTTDQDMAFGVGWNSFPPGVITRKEGSVYGFDFYGASLTWFGYYLSDLPFASTTATYALDNGDPQSFNLNGVTAQDTGVQFNQVFFATGRLEEGQHNIKVVYNGNNDTTPLSLFAVLVQNGTAALTPTIPAAATTLPGSGSTTTTSTPTLTSTPTGDTVKAGVHSGNSKKNTGAIAGGVVGGVAVLAILLLIFALCIRRRKRRNIQETIGTSVEPFTAPPHAITRLPEPSLTSSVPTPIRSVPGQKRSRNQLSTLLGSQVEPHHAKKYSNQRLPSSAPTGISSIGSSSSSNVQAGAPVAEVYVVHDDSGVRLPNPDMLEGDGVRIVNLPPTYTVT